MSGVRNSETSPIIRPDRLSWDQMKGLTIKNSWRKEFDSTTLPRSFDVGPVMLQTFDEMLPGRSLSSKLARKLTGQREEQLRPDAFEVGRRIRQRQGKILVDAKDVGESKRTLNGIDLKTKGVQGQIGLVHTHPIDLLPSDTDVVHALMRSQFFDFVVTPDRVIFFTPTTKTPKFHSDLVAKGYLASMGRANGRLGADIGRQLRELMPAFAHMFREEFGGENSWTMRYEDLAELGIYGYEAPRGKSEFRLVTHS